ncbi:MAG: exopolyphosphatase [Cytophagaceae bacterium]|nr:exopolyphosphatase [Cytophagaceae bacterium]
MKKERIAIIDMGTNTFHLLIAEKDGQSVSILLNEKVAVKIGQGGISKNFISSEAYDRALRTLSGFRDTMQSYKVEKVHAVATSAVRNARNGYAFIKDIKEKTGIIVNTIPGDKEAELIYEGVKYALNLGKSKSLVMDIGGGSVEFIICNQDQIFWKESFEIGAQRLLDLFHHRDPITVNETQELINYLEEKLSSLFEAANKYKPVTLVGSSGTFDTLWDIDVIAKGLEISMEEKEYTLSINDFERIAFEIMNKNKEERLLIPGMAEMRVDMIVVASILIQFIVSKLQVQKIRVSSYALKEGILSRVLSGKEI